MSLPHQITPSPDSSESDCDTLIWDELPYSDMASPYVIEDSYPDSLDGCTLDCDLRVIYGELKGEKAVDSVKSLPYFFTAFGELYSSSAHVTSHRSATTDIDMVV